MERASVFLLGHKGIETYFPEINECISIKGRLHERRVGLFPGYFFAKFDYDEQYRMVCYCRGVRKVLRFGQYLVEVEQGLLDDIRRRLGQNDTINLSRAREGDVVRIRHGALSGIEGMLESFLSGRERVVVLLRALSYQGRVVVNRSDIEMISAAG
jgi:transcriptional antiterminator RfaH